MFVKEPAFWFSRPAVGDVRHIFGRVWSLSLWCAPTAFNRIVFLRVPKIRKPFIMTVMAEMVLGYDRYGEEK